MSLQTEQHRVCFKPRASSQQLPRGVHLAREYDVVDHETGQRRAYREFRYETFAGAAHITVGPGHSVQEGMPLAERLLRGRLDRFQREGGVYGTVNSVCNFEDLFSGAPLALALARAGTYTEWSVGRILKHLTGGNDAPSKLHRLMADRPALVLPCQPFAEEGRLHLKPGYVPAEGKMEYVTAFGAKNNDLLLAGKLINRWSDAFHQQILQDVDYALWITGEEKHAIGLSLLPLLLGTRMDVVGRPGDRAWGTKPDDEAGELPPELAAYRFQGEDGRQRLVGLLFAPDNWRNPKVADALLRLTKTLREAGAMVFVAVIPPAFKQMDIGVFSHCLKVDHFDSGPIRDLMNGAILLDRDYAVTQPSPEVLYRLILLAERAEQFRAVSDKLADRSYFALPAEFVNNWVSEIGMAADADGSDVNGSWFLSEFCQLPKERRAERWTNWLANNPFQGEFDRQLDRYIPGVLRGRAAADPQVTYGEVINTRPILQPLGKCNDA